MKNISVIEKKLSTATGQNKLAILNELAEIFLNTSPEKAIEFAEQAIESSIQLKDRKQESIALHHKGKGLWVLGRHEKAKENYTESLAIAEELGYKTGIAVCYNSIGISHATENNHDLALEFFLKSLRAHEESDNRKGIATGQNSIGTFYFHIGNYENAL